MRLLPNASVALLACAALGLAACGSETRLQTVTLDGSAGAVPAPSAMPAPDRAEQIVSELWRQRETALASFDAATLRASERGALRTLDGAYVAWERCGCASARSVHPPRKVTVDVPRSAPNGEFFAEVETDASDGGDGRFFVIAERDSSGQYGLSFVAGHPAGTAGGTLAFRRDAHGYTPAVTAAGGATAKAAGSRLVAKGLRGQLWGGLYNDTYWGAKVSTSLRLAPQDGAPRSFPLGDGRSVSCFVARATTKVSRARGLAQGDSRLEWGPYLEPGGYRTVRGDALVSACAVTKAGKAPRLLGFALPMRLEVAGYPDLPIWVATRGRGV
jgi:hypothetical protein